MQARQTLLASGIVNDGNGGNNYAYTFVTAAGTINQLAITVTAASDTKTYDGTIISSGVPIISPGLGAGDSPDFTQVFDSRNAGSRTLTASGLVNDGNGGDNYSYTFLTAAGTINQLAITVTAASDTKTYDGTTSSAGVPIVTPGLGAGDSADFTDVFDSRNAGSQTLTASGLVNDGNGGDNYAYTFVTAAGTINPRAITITAASDTKTYDGTTASAGVPTITAGSLATGDTTTSFTQAFSSRNAGADLLLPSGIVNDGNSGDNYSYTFVSAAGTINQLAITVTAASDTKTYDGTTISTGAPTITAGSLATGDTTTSFTQIFSSRNAGPQTLTASGIVNDGNDGDNYAYTFVTAAGTINQLAITVTAASDTKTYDGTTSSAGVPLVTPGLGAGDSPDFTQVFDSRNAGSRTLIASGLVNDGNGGNNYSYTFVTAAGTINQLAITVTAASDTKTYDGTTSSAGVPIVTPGLGAGDSADFTDVFDSRNAGARILTPRGLVNDGNGGDNYSCTFLTAAGTINPRAITITAASDSKTYDGTTTSAGVPSITAGSLATGDTTTNFTQVFSSRNAGPESLVPGGIVNDGNSGDNYSYTFVSAAGTINQRAISVTAASDTKSYDGTTISTGAPTITAGSLATGDTTTSFTQVFSGRNAGPQTLTASGIVNDGNDGDNYAYTFVTAAGTINQLAITVTAASDTKAYDGTTSSAGAPIVAPGLGAGDSPDFTQVFDSRDAGSQTLTPSGSVNDGNGGNNYSYTFVTAAGTINPLAITVTAVSDAKTYDGTTSSAGVPIVTPGLGAGDSANFTQVFDSRNAGPQTLSPNGLVNDGNGGDNYSYSFVTAAGTINPRAITITAASDSKTYDGTTTSAGVPSITAGSLATGDTTTNFTQVFSSRNAGPESLVPGGIVNDGNSGDNYSYTFVSAAGTINQRAISVTAASDTKSYDGTTISTGAPTITAGSLATGDTTTSFTQVFGDRNAGPQTLTASGIVNDGNDGDNYAYTFVTAAGTINQLAITVTAASDTKTYDGTASSAGVPIVAPGLGAGDSPDFTQVFDSRDAGSQTLTPSGSVNDGNGGNNYSYTFETAAGTINPLAITVTAVSDTKAYDGTTSSAGVPIVTPGLGAGDSADFTDVFDSRNAGSRILTPSGLVNDGNGGDNYSYTFLTAAGTINPRAITITAASDTKTYDGTTTSTGVPTITAGSLATGDTTTDFIQTFLSRNAGLEALLPNGIVNDGNGGDNYSYTFLAALGTINQRAITVSAATDTKTYDGTTISTGVPTITAGSLATGDTTTSFIQVFGSRNAGAQTLTASGSVNDGNDGDNYAYTFVTAAGTINQLAITVTAASDTKTYDGTTSSAGAPNVTPGLGAGDSPDFTQVFDSRDAGSQTLTPSGSVSDGNGGNNYSYTFVTAAGTINPKAITVTAATDTKTYDGTTTSIGVPSITAGSLATGDATTNFAQVFSSRNAGPESLVPGGIVNDGNGGDNYSYTFVNAAGTINQLAITVSAASDTKTYDGTTLSSGVPAITAGGLATGDTTTTFTQVFSSRNAGPKTLTAVGIVNDGNGGANYSYTFVTAAGTINQRAITVIAASDTKTYDGTIASTGVPTITSGSLATGDTTTSFTQVFSSRNAGPETLSASGIVSDGNGGANYSYTFVTAAGTINQRAITVTAVTETKTYDGTTTAAGVPVVTGGLGAGDSPAFAQVFDSPLVGFRTIMPIGFVSDGIGGANYSYTFQSTGGTINQRAITVTADPGQTKVYGTADPTLTYHVTSGSLVMGDSLSGGLSRASGENVGVYNILQGTLSAGTNYSLFVVGASFAITPRPITVTASTATKIYDGTTASSAVPVITAGTLVPGDLANFTETFSTRNVGTNETLIPGGAVADGNGGNNYQVTFVDLGTGVITPRAITGTAATDTKTYDGTVSSAREPIVTGGLGAGDTADFTEAFDSRNAGSRILTASGVVDDGNGGANYSYTFATAAGTIDPRAITVTAASVTKTYDGTTASTGVPVITGGLGTGDSATFTQAFDSPDAGTRTLTPSGSVNDGNGGNNYQVTFASLTGTITPRPVTVTANPETKIVGQPDPAFTFQVTSGSVVAGDMFSGSLSRAAGETVGSYAILEGTLALSSNYNLKFSGANLTILPREATVTKVVASSAPSSVYGELVSFTAVVSPPSGSGAATGTVIFMDGSTELGSSPIAGSLAVLSTTSLGVGSHHIVAIYEGDSSFMQSQSPVFNQIVRPALTTTTLQVAPSSNHRGLILEASVSPAFPGGGLPSGSVVFDLNGRPLRSVRLVNGQADLFVRRATAIRKSLKAGFVSKSASFKNSISDGTFVSTHTLDSLPTIRTVRLARNAGIHRRA